MTVSSVLNFLSMVARAFFYMFVPPLVVAFGAASGWGWDVFLPVFLCSFGIDLIVGYVVNEFSLMRDRKVFADLQKAQMEYERGHVVGVSCARCGERNLVPLDLSVDAFECTKCKTVNKLYYEFRASTVSDYDRSRMIQDLANRVPDMSDDERKVWDSIGDE